MKQLGIVLLALALLVGCGGGSTPTIDGNWSANLLSYDGTTSIYAFTTSLKRGSGFRLTVTNFRFTTAPSCVESVVSVTAELDGDLQHNSGFQMDISAGPPDQVGIGIVANVQNNNTLMGVWQSRGLTSCHASGSFTMTRM